jgi:hypothetical protein
MWSAAVYVPVALVPDNPIAIDNTQAAVEDNAFDVLVSDDDTLTIIAVSQPASDSAVINASSDSFAYTIDAVTGGTAMCAVSINVTAAGSETAIYVYNIRFHHKLDGKFRRAVFEICSDDGDTPIAGMQVTATFAEQRFTAYTNENGVMITNCIRNVASCAYDANVIDLVIADYNWNRLLDLEEGSDDVLGPDARLSC